MYILLYIYLCRYIAVQYCRALEPKQTFIKLFSYSFILKAIHFSYKENILDNKQQIKSSKYFQINLVYNGSNVQKIFQIKILKKDFTLCQYDLSKNIIKNETKP